MPDEGIIFELCLARYLGYILQKKGRIRSEAALLFLKGQVS
jgi:hypothetical protein